GEENLGPITARFLQRKSVLYVGTDQGSALYATDSIGSPSPVFQLAFDFGPGALGGGTAITPDDRFLVEALGGSSRVASLDLADRRDRPRPAGGPPLRHRRAAAREGTPRGGVVSGLVLRAAESRDVEPAGDVTFVAFYRAALAHGLPPAVTTPADSRRYIRHLLEFDPLGGVMAEEDNRIVGVAWVHPRGAVATIG